MEYNKPRYNPKIHHRRSIRLKGYDYSQAGLYFITICSQNRICRFGEIVTATMILNDAGKMVDDEWLALVDRFPNIALHEYIVMPNHFHCILEIVWAYPNDDGAPKNKTIGDMMDAFKSITTVKYIHGVRTNPCDCPTGIKCMCGGWKPFDGKIWQRDYYEHIIRDEESYYRISEYIKNNPAKWKDDKFHT